MNERLIALLLLCLAARALGASLREDFSTSTHFSDTSTAVWNLGLGKAHLPFIVDDPLSGFSLNTPLNLGDGSDGAFSSSTYTEFDSQATETLVTLDTSRIYQFTTFELDSGVTLKGSGADPLHIRVQGKVEINGTIDLNGAPGADLSSDTSQNPSGGSPGCGGGAGGQGASVGLGGDGTSADPGKTGSGKAGNLSGVNGGGGGGAGYSAAGQAGAGPGGGAAGIIYGDASVSDLLGGSGGGGGGAGSNSSGAGGGGGGGVLYLEAGGTLDIPLSGAIAANGGSGGGTTSGVFQGGGGGGGSGGSLVLLAGGLITIEGDVSLLGGDAGPVSTGGGGAGGLGRAGRTRVVNQMVGNWAGGGDFNPVPQLPDLGSVVYNTSVPFVVESKSYDLFNSSPTYDSATLGGTIPAGTTATLTLAGSSDDFASDDTGFVATSALATLAGKRFVKFRLTLTSSNPAASPEITSVDITYTPREHGQFSFGFAGCARVNNTGGSAPLGFLVWLLYLATLPLTGKLRRVWRSQPRLDSASTFG